MTPLAARYLQRPPPFAGLEPHVAGGQRESRRGQPALAGSRRPMLIFPSWVVGGKKQHGGVESGSTVPACDSVQTASFSQPGKTSVRQPRTGLCQFKTGVCQPSPPELPMQQLQPGRQRFRVVLHV